MVRMWSLSRGLDAFYGRIVLDDGKHGGKE